MSLTARTRSRAGNRVRARRAGTRLRVARALGRVVSALSRRLRPRRGGRHRWPGAAARSRPTRSAELAVGRDILLVSGTNGKTTTTALLTTALRSGLPDGHQRRRRQHPSGPGQRAGRTGRPATRGAGDRRGLAALGGRAGASPRTVVLLNLSRDQLHRHHEVGRVAATLANAMTQVDLVVANADDPDIVWAAAGRACARSGWRAGAALGAGRPWSVPGCGAAVPGTTDGELELHVRTPSPPPSPTGGSRATTLGARGQHAHAPRPGAARRVQPGQRRDGGGRRVDPRGTSASRRSQQMRQVIDVAGRYAGRGVPGSARPADARQEPRRLARDDPPGRRRTTARSCSPSTPTASTAAIRPGSTTCRSAALSGRRIIVVGRRATDLLVRLEMDGLTRVERGRRRCQRAGRPASGGPVDVIANYTAFQDVRRELEPCQVTASSRSS